MEPETTEPNDKLISLRNDAEPISVEDKRVAIREILLPALATPLWEKVDEFIVEMDSISKQSESLVPAAEQFEVKSEVEYDFADHMRVTLEAEAKSLNDRRLVLTRPVDDYKSAITGATKIAIDNNKWAAEIWGRKALAYHKAEKAKAEAARLEAERAQREAQARLEEAARKKEAQVAKLKTEAARQRAQEEADALRQAAVQTPVQMAVSAPAPVSTSSNVDEKWHWEIEDWTAYCRWLGEHPEWLSDRGKNNRVVDAKMLATNKMINHYGDTIAIPGVKVWTEEHFRKKPQRG